MKNCYLVLIYILLGWMPLVAQTQRTVTGTLTDSQDKSPLPGVTVLVKGTTNGTVTDESGSYSLNVPEQSAILVFSYLGYTTQEMELTSALTSLDVQLTLSDYALDQVEVLATGYQEIPRERANGSFVGIDQELVNRR